MQEITINRIEYILPVCYYRLNSQLVNYVVTSAKGVVMPRLMSLLLVLVLAGCSMSQKEQPPTKQISRDEPTAVSTMSLDEVSERFIFLSANSGESYNYHPDLLFVNFSNRDVALDREVIDRLGNIIGWPDSFKPTLVFFGEWDDLSQQQRDEYDKYYKHQIELPVGLDDTSASASAYFIALWIKIMNADLDATRIRAAVPSAGLCQAYAEYMQNVDAPYVSEEQYQTLVDTLCPNGVPGDIPIILRDK